MYVYMYVYICMNIHAYTGGLVGRDHVVREHLSLLLTHAATASAALEVHASFVTRDEPLTLALPHKLRHPERITRSVAAVYALCRGFPSIRMPHSGIFVRHVGLHCAGGMRGLVGLVLSLSFMS